MFESLRSAPSLGRHRDSDSTSLLEVAIVASLCAAIAVAIDANQQVAIALVALILGIAALAAPAASWAIGALVAAMTFRGLVAVGALPSIASLLDIPLAWGALAVAILKRGRRTKLGSTHVRWLTALALAVEISWLFNRSEPIRPILYILLIGQPFALLAALLLEPPSPRMWRIMRFTAAGLVFIQLPFALWQAVTLGLSDHIQGTLYGAGAGAHTMSAVVALGAIWMLGSRAGFSLRRLPTAAVLLTIPFLADAKQVILALPIALLATNWWRRGASVVLPLTLVAVAMYSFVVFYPSGRGAIGFLEQARSGNGGKTLAANAIWREIRADPVSLAFGKGPAETVGRAAFLTTPLLTERGSPLRVLHLRPAAIAIDVQTKAIARSHGGTSFNGALSSALGVLGDLGLMGMAAYAGLLGSVFFAVRTEQSGEAFAASAGWAMFAVLGFVFDWWEQPPLSLFLAVLTGLVLTRPGSAPGTFPTPPAPAPVGYR